MFFSKNIKRNKYFNTIAKYVINVLILLLRSFIKRQKTESLNVVIIALHRLGDSVFTIPALRNIIDFHKTNIYLVCYPEIKPIYALIFKSINFVEINHQEFIFNQRIARSCTRRKVNNLKAKIIYDMTGDVSSASLILTSSAEQIIGINEPYFKAIYNKFKDIRKIPHIVDNYLDGINDLMPIKEFSPDIKKENQENFKIIIHPFASSKSKEWGLKNFISLARTLRSSYKCALVSLPNMLPVDVKEEIFQNDIEILETKNSVDLIEVIRKGSFVIGNDSGAVQIADLLGIPTFTIYGPTNPLYHKPRYSYNEFIFKRLSCTSATDDKWCFTQGGVFCPSNECLVRLSFDQVKYSILSMINKIETKNHG